MVLKDLELWQKYQAKYHYSKGLSAAAIAKKINASKELTKRYLKKIDPNYGCANKAHQVKPISKIHKNQELIATFFRPTPSSLNETRKQGE